MITRETQDGVAVLRLCHGKASALDTEFLREIARTMRELEESDVKACVLTGEGNIFSAGVDLKRLIEGGAPYLDEFMPALNDAFTQLFGFSKPLVAACNGHAIAGGCVMLACCDLRYVARGKGRIGVPELLVGVPFPLLPLEIMRFAVPRQHLQKVLYLGATYSVEHALDLGLCDEIVDLADLEERAIAAANQLASYPKDAFAFNKHLVRRPLWETVSAHGKDDEARTQELWKSEAVQKAVCAYVAKTLG